MKDFCMKDKIWYPVWHPKGFIEVENFKKFIKILKEDLNYNIKESKKNMVKNDEMFNGYIQGIENCLRNIDKRAGNLE